MKKIENCMKFLVDKYDENKSGVYMIINPITNHFYVGSTTNFKLRYYSQSASLRTGKHCCGRLREVALEYGIDTLVFKILEICDVDKLIEREQYYFDMLSSKYNINRYANCLYHEKESKRKMSDAHKGVKLSEAHREALSRAGKGRVFSEEHKRKIGEKNKISQLGKKHREESKQKMRSSAKRGMFCRLAKKLIDTETGEVFNTVGDACKKYNIKGTTLSMMLTGRNKNRTNLIYYA